MKKSTKCRRMEPIAMSKKKFVKPCKKQPIIRDKNETICTLTLRDQQQKKQQKDVTHNGQIKVDTKRATKKMNFDSRASKKKTLSVSNDLKKRQQKTITKKAQSKEDTASPIKRMINESGASKMKKTIALHTPNVRTDAYDHIEKRISFLLSEHLNVYMNELEKKLDIQLQLFMEKIYLHLLNLNVSHI